MSTLPRRLATLIVVAAIVAFLSIKLSAFRDYQIAEIAYEVTAVAGLTVLTGLSGQISLGHGAFMAIGGYATALLLIHLNWPFVAALVIAAAVTAVAGGVVGIAAARLRGPYLAGATLMLGVALPAVAYAYPATFGGDQGLDVTFTVPASPHQQRLADQVGRVGRYHGGAGHHAAAREPVLQQDRPQLACGPRR